MVEGHDPGIQPARLVSRVIEFLHNKNFQDDETIDEVPNNDMLGAAIRIAGVFHDRSDDGSDDNKAVAQRPFTTIAGS